MTLQQIQSAPIEVLEEYLRRPTEYGITWEDARIIYTELLIARIQSVTNYQKKE